MKSKNREVNIFNLSMLDVLSGALAAVLIIMLALAQRPSEPPGTDKQGDVSQEDYDRLKKENDDLKKKNKDMEVRRPIVLVALWYEHTDVDLYVQDFTKRMQAMPPTLEKRQWPVWPGDTAYGHHDSGDEIWMMRDMPAGPYKVYVKLMGSPPPGTQSVAYLGMIYENVSFAVGSVTLTSDNRIIHALTVTMNDNGKLSFQLQPELKPDQQLLDYMKGN